MLKLKVENKGKYPAKTWFCPHCSALKIFYSMPQRECAMCGKHIPSINTLMESEEGRVIYHKKWKIDDPEALYD